MDTRQTQRYNGMHREPIDSLMFAGIRVAVVVLRCTVGMLGVVEGSGYMTYMTVRNFRMVTCRGYEKGR